MEKKSPIVIYLNGFDIPKMKHSSFPIRFSNKKDIPSLKFLMKEIFGDHESFINLFFNYKYENNALIYEIDGEIVSFAFLLSAHIQIDNNKYPITYLYACATKPEFRGKGYMKDILEEAYKIACSRNEVGIFLLPANESLYYFYEKNNFTIYFHKTIVHYKPSQIQISTSLLSSFSFINSKEYAQIRQKILLQDGAIHWDENHFLLMEKEMTGKQSYFFKIESNSSISGIGFYSIYDNRLTVYEWLGDDIHKEALVAFLFKQYTIRSITIIQPGSDNKNGMIRFNPDFELLMQKRIGYFAFGLD